MSNQPNGWIGVDLDGTLAFYDGWKGPEYIGPPIPKMVDRVKTWLSEGREVRIFTARISKQACDLNGITQISVVTIISLWCQRHIGVFLEATNEKDMAMIQLWDDRCVQVIPNTGERADGQ